MQAIAAIVRGVNTRECARRKLRALRSRLGAVATGSVLRGNPETRKLRKLRALHSRFGAVAAFSLRGGRRILALGLSLGVREFPFRLPIPAPPQVLPEKGPARIGRRWTEGGGRRGVIAGPPTRMAARA
jgi:hypothetical protein